MTSQSTAMQPARSPSKPIRRRKVLGAALAWLHEMPPLTGSDQSRAAALLVLARELDDPNAPRYSRAKIATELRATLAELERGVEVPVDASAEANRLLALVREQ